MVVFGVDPARARETASQHGKVHCEIGRDFETREQTGHGSLLSMREAANHRSARRRHKAGMLIAKIRREGNCWLRKIALYSFGFGTAFSRNSFKKPCTVGR